MLTEIIETCLRANVWNILTALGGSGLTLDNTWNAGMQYGCASLVLTRNPGSPARDQAACLGICFSCIGTTVGSFFLPRAS